jgi:hypothetical protein
VLLIYALLMAAAAASSICAAVAGRQELLALASCAVLALLALLMWVQRLEAAIPQSSPESRIQATSSATAAVKST